MRKGRIYVMTAAIVSLVLFTGLVCYGNERRPVKVQQIRFVAETKEGSMTVRLWHNDYDDKEYLFLPSFCSEDSRIKIKTDHRWFRSWDGKRLMPGEAMTNVAPGEHRLETGGRAFRVMVMYSSKVPALILTTQSGSLSYIEEEKGNSEPGLYQLVNEKGEILSKGRLDKIRARGNMTFLEDKKPYQISLTEPADLLGTGKLKKYVLLANRQDRSLLRDRIMYDMADRMGLSWSPASCHVDLYINEEYRGSYQLSEKAEVAPNRVELKTGKGDKEFLAVLEGYKERQAEEEYFFTTSGGQGVVAVCPKNPTQAQMEFMKSVFEAAEDLVRKAAEGQGSIEDSMIDVPSFAKKYIVEETGKNLDAMFSSQYFYYKEGRLYAGPVWDYDKTLGNPSIEHNRPVDFQEPWGFYANTERENGTWWHRLYQLSDFRQAVREAYRDSAVPAIQFMLDEGIDRYREEIWDSAGMDYIRWDSFEDFKYGEEPEFEREYEAEINVIKTFLRERMEFLDAVWLEGKRTDLIFFDPGEGVMDVREVAAVEGFPLHAPRKPRREGYKFHHWIRTDTKEEYDFGEIYEGKPFTLQAVYVRDEEEKG